MALDVKLLEIPYEALSKGKDGNYDISLPLTLGTSKILNIMDRVIIVADIGGYKQPFYLSSGHGGKETVPAGKWYPFFGISDDLWINKLHSADIAQYYNSDVLKKISKQLDIVLGDIRTNAKNYPSPSTRSNKAINFINQSFSEVTSNDLPDTIKIVSKNLEQSKIKLAKIYTSTAFRDAAKQVAKNNNSGNAVNHIQKPQREYD